MSINAFACLSLAAIFPCSTATARSRPSPSVDLAYATEQLGTPITERSCAWDGLYYPYDFYSREGQTDCAKYLTDDFEIDVAYSDTRSVTSITYQPANLAGASLDAIRAFTDRVPSWLYYRDASPAPRTFGEFLTPFLAHHCEIMGFEGSGVLPGLFGIYCRSAGSSQPPGYSAWALDEATWPDDTLSSSEGFFTYVALLHDPDDVAGNKLTGEA